MENILSISKDNAVKAHRETDNKGKNLLENLFGKNVFARNPMNWVKTFEDVCLAADTNPSLYRTSTQKLELIYQVFNEGWTPNWEDGNERKYYPYFQYIKGKGFSFFSVGYFCGYSFVGSRLCCKSETVAKYIATTFINIYNEYLTD